MYVLGVGHLGFRVRAYGVGCRMWSVEFRVWGEGCRGLAPAVSCLILGVGCRV